MAFLSLVTGITAANGAPTAVQTVASMTTIAGASHVDGERFEIYDGKLDTLRIFEFDSDGQAKDRTLGSLAPNGPLNVVLIDITGTPTADQMRDRIITAINGAGLDLVAVSGGAATVTITHNRPGANNISIFEQVANGTFAVSITTAGSLSGVRVARDKEDIDTFEIWTTGAVAPVALQLQLWEFSYRSNRWLPVANYGPDAALAPLSGNDALSSQVLSAGLATPDYLYLQVSGTFSSAAVTAQLVSKLNRRTA